MVPNKQLAGYLHTQNWEKNAAAAAILFYYKLQTRKILLSCTHLVLCMLTAEQE